MKIKLNFFEILKKDNKLIFLVFYITGSLFLSILIIFVKDIQLLLKFNLSLKTILFLTLVFLILFLIELLNKNDRENLYKIRDIFGEKVSILYIFVLCIFGAYFEEILFRGYLYILFKNVFNILINNKITVNIISVILISLIFGLMHINQKIYAFILSFLISIIFFISIFISNSLIYPIIFHFLFNFLEFTLILPYKIKRYENRK